MIPKEVRLTEKQKRILLEGNPPGTQVRCFVWPSGHACYVWVDPDVGEQEMYDHLAVASAVRLINAPTGGTA